MPKLTIPQILRHLDQRLIKLKNELQRLEDLREDEGLGFTEVEYEAELLGARGELTDLSDWIVRQTVKKPKL